MRSITCAEGIDNTFKQQNRHALNFLTTACEAALHGRQPPSLLPAT